MEGILGTKIEGVGSVSSTGCGVGMMNNVYMKSMINTIVNPGSSLESMCVCYTQRYSTVGKCILYIYEALI